MHKFSVKHLACGLVLSGVCVAVNAATTVLGPVTVGIPKPFQGAIQPAGPLDDFFTFILPSNLGSGYSVMNFPLTVAGPGGGTFSSVLNTMSLVTNPDGVLFNADDFTLASTVAPGGESLSLLFGPTPAGNYYLNITGITNGTLGGLYNGAISVSAIPEPEVWAMMLIGAGLVGFQLRRKSKQISVQRFV